MTATASLHLIEREPLIQLDDELEAFLADPIGYGAFDPTDPITLEEFSEHRHHHSLFAAPLAF